MKGALLTCGDVLFELRPDGRVAVPSVWGPTALYPDLRAFLAAVTLRGPRTLPGPSRPFHGAR